MHLVGFLQPQIMCEFITFVWCYVLCMCVCAMSHLARNVLQYVTGGHDYIVDFVTEITTLKKDIFQKLLVVHLVKKFSIFDGL